MSLPIGTVRMHKEVSLFLFQVPKLVRVLIPMFDLQHYEEIVIPAPKAVPFRFNESLVPIKDMNPWGKRTFHVTLSLLINESIS